MAGKYALLIGINYRGSSAELQGCINDVVHMKEYLMRCRGYNEDHIVVLTEDVPEQPTAENIEAEIRKLVAHPAEELWLHYSGHGSYVIDSNGEEDDKKDETIVPLDYQSGGLISDDYLHNLLNPVQDTTRLVCLFDCCHSGTILDLEFQYHGGDRNVVENHHCDLQGNIIMFSGCTDVQTSADALHANTWQGAMTRSFLDSQVPGITCENLLLSMRSFLKSHGYTQYPQLTSTHPVEDEHLF